MHVPKPLTDSNITRNNRLEKLPVDHPDSSADSRPLGAYTEFAAASGKSLHKADLQAAKADAQLKRFYLQTIARTLINGREPQHGKISTRTCSCLRCRISKDKPVEVMHVAATGSAHYGNLQACANVWLCAPCSSKISERRRQELTDGFARHPELFKALATYTVRHNKSDFLKPLQDDLDQAHRWLRKHRRYKTLLKRFGCVGFVRGLEPLHNADHGWHPHFHEIMLFDHRLTADELAELDAGLKALWLTALRRFGRDGDWEHAFMLTMDDHFIDEYLAKFDRLPNWTIAHEIAKSQVKGTHSVGRTPNELLMLYGAGDQRAGDLWLEFAAAFRGKHQLQWSTGLKALLGIEDKTDAQLALEEREQATPLVSLELWQWKLVLANDCRAELLNVAADGDPGPVMAFIAELVNIRDESYAALRQRRQAEQELQDAEDAAAIERSAGPDTQDDQTDTRSAPPALAIARHLCRVDEREQGGRMVKAKTVAIASVGEALRVFPDHPGG